MRGWYVAALLPTLVSCAGTTGYELVSFYAAAEGPADAERGQTYTFMSGDFEVVLRKAVIHIGAVYLDQSLPTSGAAESTCTLPGTYVGEVRAGRDVDMLDPTPQLFPIAGEGSTIPAAVGQVWLSGDDVFSIQDSPVVLSVEGTATSGSLSIPFSADLTIGANRSPASVGSALPGANPICEKRIVTPISAPLALGQSGTLVLHLEPKNLFENVDFRQLPRASGSQSSFAFTDDSSNTPSSSIYNNLRGTGIYRFQWLPARR